MGSSVLGEQVVEAGDSKDSFDGWRAGFDLERAVLVRAALLEPKERTDTAGVHEGDAMEIE